MASHRSSNRALGMSLAETPRRVLTDRRNMAVFLLIARENTLGCGFLIRTNDSNSAVLPVTGTFLSPTNAVFGRGRIVGSYLTGSSGAETLVKSGGLSRCFERGGFL